MGLLICNLAPGLKFRQDTLNTLKYVHSYFLPFVSLNGLIRVVSQFARKTWKTNPSSTNVVSNFTHQRYLLHIGLLCMLQSPTQIIALCLSPTFPPCRFNLRLRDLLLLWFKLSLLQDPGPGQGRVTLAHPLFLCQGLIACHHSGEGVDIKLSASMARGEG